MASKAAVSKPLTICGACGEQFKGKKCPECGNTDGNSELSPDGIPKSAVYGSTAFGSASSLRPADLSFNREIEMREQVARSQEEELSNNLRETFVLKSEIKRLALEDALRKKQLEINPPARPTEPDQKQYIPENNMVNPFQFNSLTPQAQFMNQFMKMDVNDRSEFLEQLSDADPAALSTLSTFFTHNNLQMPHPNQMNPFGQMPMSPYMQYPSPWMQPQPHEPQYQSEDSMSLALAIVDKLQELSSRNQPAVSQDSNSVVSVLREELNTMNERIASLKNDKSKEEADMFNRRMTELENYLYSPKEDKSLRAQIAGIKEMVSDLREIGFIDAPESKQTVDEQIKLSTAKHQISKEDREIELREKELAAQAANKQLQQKLVSTLFSRQLQKNLKPTEGTGEGREKNTSVKSITPLRNSVYVQKKPDVIADEFITDAGIVRETSIPVSKRKEE